MKILQVNKLYTPWIGGIETVAQDIAEGLQGNNGLVVENLVCQPKGCRKVDIIDGVVTHRAASFGMKWGMPLSLDFFILFRKLIRDVDIVFLHHPFPLAFVAYWLFGRQKRVVVWYHSDIVKQKFSKIPFLPFIRFTLKRSEHIFVSNQSLIRNSKELALFSQSCRVIYFGVDLDRFYESTEIEEQVLNIKSLYGTPLILSVGRLVYYKGFSYLISSMTNVQDGNLLIIGDGPLKEDLLLQVEMLGLKNRVFIISPVKDLVPYYFACDLFALSSCEPAEVFGIVQIEAMACGKPVVNTSLSTGVPEVSVNEKTGLTVPPKDNTALALAINKILKDKKLSRAFSVQAKKDVAERFSKKVFISHLKKFLI